MLNRAVSLLMIAVVVGCPLWCFDDCGCCAGGMFSMTASSTIQTRTTQTRTTQTRTMQTRSDRATCCRQYSQLTPAEDAATPNAPFSAPERAPDKSSCQGVCGGAVFEKPCELDGFQLRHTLPPLADDVATSPAPEHGFAPGVEHPCICTANFGRSVRTLQMSFLC